MKVSRILLRTVDIDVVELSVAATKIYIHELSVAFGTGQHLRYIPAHQIAASLGPNISCLHWERHSVIRYMGKQDSMAYLGSICENDTNSPDSV